MEKIIESRIGHSMVSVTQFVKRCILGKVLDIFVEIMC